MPHFMASSQVEAGASAKELAAQLGEAQLLCQASARREEALQQQLESKAAEVEVLNAELDQVADDWKHALDGARNAHESRLALEKARAVRAEAQVEDLKARIEQMRVMNSRLKTEAAQRHAKEMQQSRDASPLRPALRTPSSSPFMRRAGTAEALEAIEDLSSGTDGLQVQMPSRTMSPLALRSPGGRRSGSWTSASSTESVE